MLLGRMLRTLEYSEQVQSVFIRLSLDHIISVGRSTGPAPSPEASPMNSAYLCFEHGLGFAMRIKVMGKILQKQRYSVCFIRFIQPDNLC